MIRSGRSARHENVSVEESPKREGSAMLRSAERNRLVA
jgi:hypothetical protein